jgi:hypothetical protein
MAGHAGPVAKWRILIIGISWTGGLNLAVMVRGFMGIPFTFALWRE